MNNKNASTLYILERNKVIIYFLYTYIIPIVYIYISTVKFQILGCSRELKILKKISSSRELHKIINYNN